jgi:hypothetical protein
MLQEALAERTKGGGCYLQERRRTLKHWRFEPDALWYVSNVYNFSITSKISAWIWGSHSGDYGKQTAVLWDVSLCSLAEFYPCRKNTVCIQVRWFGLQATDKKQVESRASSGFEWKPSQSNRGDTEKIHGRSEYEYPVSCPRFKAGRSRRSIQSFTATWTRSVIIGLYCFPSSQSIPAPLLIFSTIIPAKEDTARSAALVAMRPHHSVYIVGEFCSLTGYITTSICRNTFC